MTDTDRPTPQATDTKRQAVPTTAEPAKDDPAAEPASQRPKTPQQPPGEIGGRDGPEPTRYGDWEVGGRCTDF